MTSRNIRFKWVSDSSQLEQSFNQIVAQAKRVERALADLGRPAAQKGMIDSIREQTEESQKHLTTLKQLEKQFDKLKQAEAAFAKGEKLRVSEQTRFAAGLPLRGKLNAEQAQKGAQRLEAAAAEVEAKIVGAANVLEEKALKAAEAIAHITVQESSQASFQRDVDRVASGQAVDEASAQRILRLEEARNRLIERRGILQQGVFDAVGGKTATDLQKQLNDLKREEGAIERSLAVLVARRVALAERLKEVGTEAVRAQIDDAIRPEEDRGKKIEVEAAGIDDETLADLAQIKQLTDQITEAESNLAEVRNRAAKPRQQFDDIASSIGELENLDQVIASIGDLDESLLSLRGPERLGELEKFAPGATESLVRLNEVTIRLREAQATLANSTDLESKAYDNLGRRVSNLTKLQVALKSSLRETLNEFGEAQDVPLLDNIDQLVARLPALERTLIGAFRGIGRRFQATLQFALSAALIFGVQRFLREFIQTAIEVERAFADIGTALEFDIPDERGSIGFAKAVSDIRQEVLALSEEFNVLPTVANEIAFTMVSRFELASNAVKAMRAQMLALKVSTIDTEEIIRALTATAEGFAAATFEVDTQLSLQERLLKRETVAANLYAEALDLATAIQQNWGVSLEDTIEGTARANEVFRQLGFSMQETAAIIASTSLRLGQTGTNVAERLNRSIGQITSPEVRDQLLDLAAANDSFSLSFSDFATGADALRAIMDQFDRIQKVDPVAAQRILQIVGQRREIEVVAAVFGTKDIQEDINNLDDIAGSAEKRFAALKLTTQELLNSLSSGFEQLAQNLAVLGGLSPFKILLNGADLLLKTVNFLLKQVEDILLLLSRIPIIGFIFKPSVLGNIVSISLALLTVSRLLKAIGESRIILGVGNLIEAAAGVSVAAGGGRAAGGAALLTVASTKLASVFARIGTVVTAAGVGLKSALVGVSTSLLLFKGSIIASTVAIIKEIAARIKLVFTQGVGGAFSGPAAVGLKFTAGLLAAVGVFLALKAVTEGVIGGFIGIQRSVDDFNEAIREAASRTRLEIAQREAETGEPVTDIQASVIEARNNLQVAQEAEPTVTGIDARITEAFLSFFQLFSQEVRDSIADGRANELFALSGQTPEVARSVGGDRRVVIPGTVENLEALEAEALKKVMILELNAILEEIALGGSLGTTEGGTSIAALTQRQAASLRADLTNIVDADGIFEFEDAWLAFTRQREIWALEANKSAQQVNDSINSLATELDELQSDLSFGRISPEQAAAKAGRIRAAQLVLADDADAQGFDDAGDNARQEAERAFQVQSEAIAEAFDRRRELSELFGSEEGNLRKQIDLFAEEVRKFQKIRNFEAARQAGLQLIEAERNLQAFLITQIERQAALNLRLADTLGERIAILRKLKLALFNASFRALIAGNLLEMERLAEASINAGLEAADLVKEEGIRRVAAEAARAGPILANLTKINAQLTSLRAKLATLPSGSVEALETLNAINLQIAAEAQELLRVASAYVLLQAGVGNTLRSVQAQYTIVNQEIALAVQLFGAQSAEVFTLQLRQQELKRELENLALELRDLDRRLGSDITNTFEQAQLDLLSIMEKLTAPDLGPLEKARLELEKKNAEAAAKRAFFDDRLFQLQFAFETGEIGLSAYISSLEKLLETVDTSTQQGKEIFLQIQGLIDSLSDDVSDLAFNIPSTIRLPTLFEIRRDLAADQLGVNYLDNRQQNINIIVSDSVSLEEVIRVVEDAFGSIEANRTSAGAAGVTFYGAGGIS